MAVTINADNGVSSGSAGLKQTADSTGVLALQTNGTTAVTVDTSQNVTLAGNLTTTGYANIPNNFGFKNRIINGDIRVWQRGTSGTSVAVGVYGPDRWRVGGGNALTLTQSTSYGTPYSLLIQATGTNHVIGQRIEALNIQDLAGQTVTLSYKIRADNSGTHKLLMYYAGTTNDFSAEVNFVNAAISYTSNTVTTITYTTTLPANAANGLDIVFQWYNGGASISITAFIWDVQLEAGPTATSFDRLSIGTELALCQRYCFALISTGANNSTFVGGWRPATSAVQTSIPFPVVMRTTPTTSVPAGNNSWSVEDGFNPYTGTPSTVNPNPYNVTLSIPASTPTFASGYAPMIHMFAASGSVCLLASAEL